MIEIDRSDFAVATRVDTCDVDAARTAIGEIFCPHFLAVENAASRHFHARHHVTAGNGYSVNLVSYGAAVEIDPGELSRFFLLQIPLKGGARVRCGTREVLAVAGQTASLLSPTLATRMNWSEGCEKYIVLMERTLVERFMEDLTQEPADRIEFDPTIELGSAAGKGVVHHAALMLSALSPRAGLPPQYTTILRDGLISLLLTGFQHNRTGRLRAPAPESGPTAVRKADEFIRANAAQAIGAADIAAAAGVPLRTLQDSYRKARGATLMDALQVARLEALRRHLLEGDPDLSVADAVFASGLGHLGRAAAIYRQRYGETPSETLRRTKR
ncbi:MAG: AraC family transcriptional regulator [Rhizobium sp.]|nr:MAG: AraC family transcriptional regulator [Rhizobium sp.]